LPGNKSEIYRVFVAERGGASKENWANISALQVPPIEQKDH